jgi:hypothetical protein
MPMGGWMASCRRWIYTVLVMAGVGDQVNGLAGAVAGHYMDWE